MTAQIPALSCVFLLQSVALLCKSVSMTDSQTVAFSGARLRRLRLRKGWSLRDLEARTGITFAVLARYERGDYAPQPRRLPVLAEALGAEVDDLLTGSDGAAA